MPWRRRRPASVPDGLRVCAIGDVHGCLGPFGDLMERLDADLAGRPSAETRIIVLGDFIDRGPDSAKMVDLLRTFSQEPNVTVLMGNHEAVAVDALRGEPGALRYWMNMGGGTALESWGVPYSLVYGGSESELAAAAREYVPADAIDWLANLPHYEVIGDYLFVHAGIRPGVALADQQPRDLLWIRDDFLRSRVDHGMTVVHGHSASETVQQRGNRIGIDTGAYWTGRLTALCLEGRERWLVST